MIKLPGIRRPRLRGWAPVLWANSVRGRIIAGFGLLIVILIAVVAGGAWVEREHQSRLAGMEDRSDIHHALDDAWRGVAEANLQLERYLVGENEYIVPKIRSSIAQAIENIAQARALEEAQGHERGEGDVADDGELEKLDEITAEVGAFSKTSEQVIALARSDDMRAARLVLEASAPQLRQLGIHLTASSDHEREEVLALRAQAARTADLALALLVTAGAVGAALGLAASLYTARSILRPLSRVESSALAVAEGDLETRAPTAGPRELAHLGESLNRMTESLLDASKRRELEAALRESEAKKKALLDAIPDLMFRITRDGEFLDFKASDPGLLFAPPDKIIGSRLTDLMPPDFVDRCLRYIAKTLDSRGAQIFEYDLPMPQGIRHFEARMVASGADEVFAIVRDVTERKLAEEEIERLSQQNELILNSAGEGIYGLDLQGRTTFVNPAAARMIGWTVDELVGKPQHDVLHHSRADGTPYPREECPIYAAFKDGRVHHEDNEVFWKKDGSSFPVEYVSTPISDERGELVGAVVTFSDITERKQAEEALRESEERARLIVETAQDAFISIDAGGLITAWNTAAEAIFGWKREDVIGRSLAEMIVPPGLRETHAQGIERFLTTGEGPVLNKRVEITAVRRDGQEFPSELAVWAVGSGDSVSFNAFIHDISRRKQAEEMQRRLNDELEEEHRRIEALNRSLEAKVEERTEDLRMANEELRQRNRQLLDARAQAATDALTGLLNHRSFQEKARAAVERARKDGAKVGLIMMDIDGFKKVNDSLGHQAGDEILRELASVLDDTLGEKKAYRYGGDEFAALLPGTDRRGTAAIAEKLRDAVEVRVASKGSGITISLGCASFPDVAETPEELIYGADAAMYWAKSAGKNRVGDWGRLSKSREDGEMPWFAADRSIRAPDAVAALVAALAAKDPVTAEHTERCSRYSGQLAEELGLSEGQASVIRLASLLHDIGKLAVPDEVLFKPGPLNEDEWEKMKGHSTAALALLNQIRSVSDAVPAVLHHHEHFDGSGYPDGLAGDEIPLASRILLVTDAFDAMTSDRPYREAMPEAAAIEELRRNSGTQFDPEVVEAFLKIVSHHDKRPRHTETAGHEGEDESGDADRKRGGIEGPGERRRVKPRGVAGSRSR